MAVPSPTPKQALRADALARRKVYAASLADQTRRSLEAALTALVLPHLVTARTVAGYYPMREEISPLPLLEAVASAGGVTALPWFADRDARMIFREAPAVGAGPWGVLQPADEARALRPDALLVPVVLADRSGTRIGHGKGHYDRAIAHLGGDLPAGADGRHHPPPFTIGLAWEWQLSEDLLARDPWDMPLDAIATPGEWILCKS